MAFDSRSVRVLALSTRLDLLGPFKTLGCPLPWFVPCKWGAVSHWLFVRKFGCHSNTAGAVSHWLFVRKFGCHSNTAGAVSHWLFVRGFCQSHAEGAAWNWQNELANRDSVPLANENARTGNAGDKKSGMHYPGRVETTRSIQNNSSSPTLGASIGHPGATGPCCSPGRRSRQRPAHAHSSGISTVRTSAKESDPWPHHCHFPKVNGVCCSTC